MIWFSISLSLSLSLIFSYLLMLMLRTILLLWEFFFCLWAKIILGVCWQTEKSALTSVNAPRWPQWTIIQMINGLTGHDLHFHQIIPISKRKFGGGGSRGGEGRETLVEDVQFSCRDVEMAPSLAVKMLIKSFDSGIWLIVGFDWRCASFGRSMIQIIPGRGSILRPETRATTRFWWWCKRKKTKRRISMERFTHFATFPFPFPEPLRIQGKWPS